MNAEEKLREHMRARASTQTQEDVDISIVRNGVTANWIAGALGMSIGTVRVKLAKCPATKRNAINYYSLAEAMEYLVKPKTMLDLKKLKKEDLPAALQESYWSALLKRQQWEEKAQHLWHSEDVMSVFGKTFQAIKFAVQLWIDDMERETPITPDQYKFLVAKCDELQQKVYDELLKVPMTSSTASSRTMHKDEPPVESTEEEIEDDISSLV